MMNSPFLSVARVALEEIIKKHTQPSKFGHFLTEAALRELVADLLEFVQTSRKLKVGGDRHLQKALEEDTLKSRSPSRPTLR